MASLRIMQCLRLRTTSCQFLTITIIIENVPAVKCFFLYSALFSSPLHRYFHQDHICPDLTDAGKINDKLLLPAKYPEKLTRSRHDDMADTPLAQIKDHILHITEPLPVAHIDDFFFPEITNPHCQNHAKFIFINVCGRRIFHSFMCKISLRKILKSFWRGI